MLPENKVAQPPDRFCSRWSLAADEPLAGTASRIDVWFLLQYAAPWAANALAGSGLPDAVKRQFRRLMQAQPGWRLLLMKRESRAVGPFAFYVAVADEMAPRLYQFALDNYEDLLRLDLPAIVAGDPAYAAHASTEPVFLVCTHGTHDPCCAKFGLPVYRALARHAPAATWQSAHVGGDRFAANLLCFPHGLYYGHVTPDEAPAIVDTYRQGAIALERYRGRSSIGFIPQAAEYYLRQHTGVLTLPGFECLGVRRPAPERWVVEFATLDGGVRFRVHLTGTQADPPIYLNCKATEPTVAEHYRLLGVETQP